MQELTDEGMSPTIVVAVTDHEMDKYTLLEMVLDKARFFEVVNTCWRNSGKPKQDFRIAVKPNLSMMLRRSDVGTYTDPFLVIHVLRLLLKKGYTNLAVVETQNLFGNWFHNRSVIQVGVRAGYLDESVLETWNGEKSASIHVRGDGVDADVPLIDLTVDTAPYDFGPPVGTIPVGRAWIEADFRINFSKFKTHFYSLYSLAIKNIYGCLPFQDKVREYHCRRVVGLWTAHMIRAFPVHFSIVDAYSAADGWLGVKTKAICVKPHTIIAGTDILAVDHFGAHLMQVRPEKSVMFTSLTRLLPLRPYQVVGNAVPVKHWRRCPRSLAVFCETIESNANIMDFMGALATGGHDDCFPRKKAYHSTLKTLLYYLTVPANILVDVGVVRLRLRERLLFRRLKKYQQRIPLVSGSPFLLSRLTFLGLADLDNLISIMDQGIEGEVSSSGHYMVVAGREVPFPARLSTTNLAAMEILKHIQHHKPELGRIAEEFRVIKQIYQDSFGEEKYYPYCYR